jgi:hypothetical protein
VVKKMTLKVPIIMLLTLIAFLVMPTSFAQSDDDAQMILLTFSEPMSKEGIFDINNYEVIANGNVQARIFKVGVVEGDTAVVLYIEKNYKWETYTIEVSNLKDLAGNTINYKKNFAFVDSRKMEKFEQEY